MVGSSLLKILLPMKGETIDDLATSFKDAVDRYVTYCKTCKVDSSIAAAHGADFILTWNFKHIANPMMQRRIAGFFNEINLPLPFICSPEELLGEDDGTISN